MRNRHSTSVSQSMPGGVDRARASTLPEPYPAADDHDQSDARGGASIHRAARLAVRRHPSACRAVPHGLALHSERDRPHRGRGRPSRPDPDR